MHLNNLIKSSDEYNQPLTLLEENVMRILFWRDLFSSRWSQ